MADVTHAADLGIDLSDGKPQQLYRWFLASMLFGRPIRQEQAATRASSAGACPGDFVSRNGRV
ncbi:hypothetical protein [Curtobacterium sp. 24E2]|nr:hypothetical protein JN350_16710 [Curtobacterium sp. 24E2]